MDRRAFATLSAAALLTACGAPAQQQAAIEPAPAPVGGPVVVELFQSQGCSSCPPANAIVNDLAEREGLIVLSFAVTYWDQLGWRDTFATDEYTARQYDYRTGLGRANVATPQMVINGHIDLVGNRRAAVEDALRGAAPLTQLRATQDAVLVSEGAAPEGGADVWLVRYDPRVHEIAIRSGENAGRTLPHKNIVRQLTLLGRWTGEQLTLRTPEGSDPELRSAYLVQTRGGPILAAALAPA